MVAWLELHWEEHDLNEQDLAAMDMAESGDANELRMEEAFVAQEAVVKLPSMKKIFTEIAGNEQMAME